MWSRLVGTKNPPHRLAPSMLSLSGDVQAAALWALTRPVAERILTASRATVRLVPRRAARFFSVGIRSPGCRASSLISCRICSATSS